MGAHSSGPLLQEAHPQTNSFVAALIEHCKMGKLSTSKDIAACMQLPDPFTNAVSTYNRTNDSTPSKLTGVQARQWHYKCDVRSAATAERHGQRCCTRELKLGQRLTLVNLTH